jgi:hypothetical protein
MFDTRTEALGRLNALEPSQYYEITYKIEMRRTGQRAAATLMGEPAQLIEQMQVLYDDGWGIAGTVDFTRRNTNPFRIPVGANRTRFGY